MLKEIVTLLLAAVLTAACTRSPAPPVSPNQPSPGQTDTAPASSPGPAPSGGAVLARYEIDKLPTRSVAPLSGGKPISFADDAGWLEAKKGLGSLLRASSKAPAPGLAEHLAAYLRRPEVALLPAAMALGDIRGITTLGGATGTKQGPLPEDPRVYLVRSPYDGASPCGCRRTFRQRLAG